MRPNLLFTRFRFVAFILLTLSAALIIKVVRPLASTNIIRTAAKGAAPVIANTRYVATTGNNASNNCLNSLSPCASLSYAAGQAVSGDTIQIEAGIYTEAGTDISGKSLTIIGAGTEATILQAAASPGIATDRVLRLSGQPCTLQDLTIRHGVSPSGGGINIVNSQVTLNNVAVTDNRAMDVGATTGLNGGGISINSGSLTLNNSTVSNNTVTTSDSLLTRGNGGGIFIGASAPVTLNNSTVSGNSAIRGGGGIYFSGSAVNISYSTIAGNTSDSDNDGVGDGGGVYRGSSAFNLKSSIVAGNKKGASGTTNAVADCGGTITSQNYNLTGSGTGCSFSGTGDQTVAPANVFTGVLGPLANNGGPTRTHALLGGSPALNAIAVGVNGCGSVPFDQDQRNKLRPINATCDIGAYEAQLSITRDSVSPTNAGSVSWTVRFGDPVSSLTNSNFALAIAGLGGMPAITGVAPIGGAPSPQWTVTASTGSGAGTLGLNMMNSTGVSPSVPEVPFTGPLYSIDTVKPAVTINQAAGQTDPTNDGPINFTVVFSKSVAGFATGDVTLSGTAGATTATVSETAPNNGTTYNVAVTGMTATGTVIASIAANVASDALGNSNLASTSTDNTVQFVNCLSPLTVNSLGDTADASPGNGVCADSNGNCTLRAAIEEANALTVCSMLTINFSVTGTISLVTALPTVNHPNLTINGPGANNLTVQRSTAMGTANFRIFNINMTAALSDMTITNGNAGSANGGGIQSSAVLALTRCIITGNMGQNGAGMNLIGGSCTLTDCVVSDNTALGAGGGIYSQVPLTVVRSTISGNTAVTAGGIGLLNGTLMMTDSTVSGNVSSTSPGGGCFLQDTTATLRNCTFSNNTATNNSAGAIYHNATNGINSLLNLVNCTITGNSSAAGGALRTQTTAGALSSVTQLKNTLTAGNTGSNFVSGGVTASLVSQGNNLDSDGTSGFTNGLNGDLAGTVANKINALLSPRGNYGGPTQTHALLPGSPAINAGTATGAPATDQRGIARVGNVDIGAFESRGFTLATSSGDSQTAAAGSAFALPLSVSVSSANSERVNGGQVTFTPPGAGASASIAANPATIASGAATTGIVTANSTLGGPYSVAASANGAAPVDFLLTNTCPAISVNNPTSNTGTAGVAFSQTFTQSGGIGTVTFSTVSALPMGVTLSTAGILSGTPAQTGTFPISVNATDSNGCMGIGVIYTLIIGCPTITIINPVINSGIAGVSFSQTFAQSGGVGTISYSAISPLPAGLTFSNNGLLAGTPAQTGIFPITVTATDANGCTGTGATYALEIYSTVNLAPAPTPEVLYYKFDGTGTTVPNEASAPPAGTANATILGGMTQGGTNLCPATSGGTLIGAGESGVTDYLNTGWATNLGNGSWTVSFKTSNVGTSGVFYAFGDVTTSAFRCFANGPVAGAGNWLLRANGMEDVVAWGGASSTTSTTTFVYDATAGNVKAYVNGNLVNVVTQAALSITGIGPFKVGGYSVMNSLPTGVLLDDFRVYNRALSQLDVLSISTCTLTHAPTITPITQSLSQGSAQTLPIATVSDVETPAGSLIVTATSVPKGISVSNITNTAGNISALIAADCSATVGNNSVVLTVSDGKGRTATGTLSVNVTANTAPSLSYPASTIGQGGSASIAPTTATDNGLIVGYSIVNVTPAMTVAPTVNASGVVSISNAGPLGNHTIVVQATDNCGAMTNASFTVNVVTCGSITISPTTLLNGLTGVSYAQTLSATGGTGSYAFSLTSGTLPAGLSLSGNLIVGIPTTAGASTFTIRATDANVCFGERTYTVVIGSTGLMYYPLARPVRLLDTRKGASPNACNQPNAQITGGTSLTVTGRGSCDGMTIPANATTLTGHATMVQPAGNGFLTLFPGDVPQPTVASSNFLASEVLNNAFTVGLGAADGALKVFVTATSHVVIDVTGYYAPPTTGGLYFHPLPKPIRLLETRAGFTGCQTTGAPLPAGSTRLQTGVLTCDGVTIPTGAQALVGNATTTNTASNGFLTLYPADAAQPFTASSNYVAGVNRNAPFTVGLSLNGEFNIFTAAATDLVIDVMGYFSAQANDVNGQGLLFNSLGSPLRLMDTRAGQSACYTPGAPMTGGTVYTQETQVSCSNLTASARGLVGNVSALNAVANGFLTFWPNNAAQPTVATSNYQTGRVFNRHFTVGLGTDTAFKRFTSSTTDLIIDISGFFAP